MSAIILRSGKEVEISVKASPTLLKQKEGEKDVTNKNATNDTEVTEHKFLLLSDYKPIPNFS